MAPLTIKEVSFRRFKQFSSTTVVLTPGITLLAGGNNAGKSSLLHGLAVWEFCRTATVMERGEEGLLDGAMSKQGFGLGDDEFSPINVPSLKHLWTNLKTQAQKASGDTDGYTLRITCKWDDGEVERVLGFGLALANDRLFIRTAESNLGEGDAVPTVAYLPPFAGITAHEQRISGAIRRRRIGEGLAGAVLRNLLLDMQQTNVVERSRLRSVAEGRAPQGAERAGARPRISDADLKNLREQDPWELLQHTLREVFKTEIQIDEFREEYHSYINVEVVKGVVEGYKLTRHHGFNPRDLMVEGSGFLQWLSVYTLATNPGLDVLLFDEPDAHLHPSLQRELLEHLERLAVGAGKQVLLATHSSEILRAAEPEEILQMRSGGSAHYLKTQDQQVALLEGLGSDYAPRIDAVRRTGRIFFFEGSSDIAVLQAMAGTLGLAWPANWVEWPTTASHKDRRSLWRALQEDLGPIKAYSLRDRDDQALASVDEELRDTGESPSSEAAGFYSRKWRRRYIEAYLLWPPTLAACSGKSEEEVRRLLQDDFGIAVGATFPVSKAPQALLDVRAKAILADLRLSAVEVAPALPVEAICADVRMVLEQLTELESETS